MAKELNKVYVVAYGRSPIAKAFKGGLKDMHPADYAAQVVKGVIKQVPQLRLDDIEDLICGCAKPEGVQSYNIGRIIAVRSGLPYSVPGQTINRFCSSGLQAISTAANMIMTGQSDVIIAGGVEDMTKIPMGSVPETRNKWISENEPNMYISMGLTAENVAEKYKVTREEMDRFSVDSHLKASNAKDNGLFKSQIIPINAYDNEGNEFEFTEDECIRPNANMENMATLKTVFKSDGVVTAGTASQMSDGASFIILMSRKKMNELGIKPIAEFLGYAVKGVDPAIMGVGPIVAVPKVMEYTGLTVKDMDVIELNEAFAAQAIPCINELGLDKTKVNPNGGAIALGHPMGATGGILTCKALAELERIDGNYALVTMCIGLGMGAAAIYRRCK